MSLVISDEVLRSAGMTEQELGAEIALLLYRQQRLTLAQAARFAEFSRTEFQRYLASRGEHLNLDESDFEQDVRTLEALRRP